MPNGILPKLTIRIVTKEQTALKHYATEFYSQQDETIHSVLQKIFEAIGFDDKVKLTSFQQEQLHDRAIR